MAKTVLILFVSVMAGWAFGALLLAYFLTRRAVRHNKEIEANKYDYHSKVQLFMGWYGFREGPAAFSVKAPTREMCYCCDKNTTRSIYTFKTCETILAVHLCEICAELICAELKKADKNEKTRG